MAKSHDLGTSGVPITSHCHNQLSYGRKTIREFHEFHDQPNPLSTLFPQASVEKFLYNPMEHDVKNLRRLSLAYRSFQVSKELLLQAVKVVEILYAEEEDSTIEEMSYGYQAESDSRQYSYQTHLGSVDEFAL